MSRHESIEYLRKLCNKDVPITDNPIPDTVEKAARIQADGAESKNDYAASIQAWTDFCERFRQTKSKRQKTVMQQVANFALASDMGIAYVLTTGLEQALTTERRARRGLYPDTLYSIVGDCIAAGLNWTNINIQTGSSNYRLSGEERMFRGRYEDWTATEILGAHIEIGKHRLDVGTTVPRILALLEARYGLNFRELEKARSKGPRQK